MSGPSYSLISLYHPPIFQTFQAIDEKKAETDRKEGEIEFDSPNRDEIEIDLNDNLWGKNSVKEINDLSFDLLSEIFKWAADPYDPQGTETLASIRLVCKTWRDTADLTLFQLYWQKTRQIPHPNLSSFATQIERTIEDETPSDDWQPSSLPKFHRLTETLKHTGAPIPSRRSSLGISPFKYLEVQQKLDVSLEQVWSKILVRNPSLHSYAPHQATTIRAWLANPANRQQIPLLENFNLSTLQLTTLPSEIGYFTELTWLSLQGNQLMRLPPSIGNLYHLTELILSNNQLTFLPETLGNLTRLTTLYLFDNQLTALPHSIQNLTQLTKLGLSRNCLQNFPPSITHLCSLEELFLSRNSLSELPYSLENLSRLSYLYLSDNHLTSIQTAIHHLPQLQQLHLNGNPFLTLLEQDQAEHKNLFRFQDVAAKYNTFLNYPCQSPLGTLCQGILRDADDEALNHELHQLSPEMKQQIANHAQTFFDVEPFSKKFLIYSVIEVVKKKLNEVSSYQKSQIKQDLAGPSEEKENLSIRLIDKIDKNYQF